MRKRAPILLAFLFCLFAIPAFADLAAIQRSALPQDPAVLAALDDAAQFEPYVRSWTQDWDYPVAREEVAAHLSNDLTALSQAAKDHPDNEELLLLTGLVAHYAYNVDVQDSFDTAVKSLAAAQKLAPADVRPPWFHADLQCQTSQPQAGAAQFLSIEAGHAVGQLPSAFWNDYIVCASLTNMPVHIRRAASYLGQLNATVSQRLIDLINTARMRVQPYDPDKTYDPRQIWRAENAGDDSVFTSTICGVRFRLHGNWSTDQLGLTGGSCLAHFSTGPYKATAGDLQPSILLIARRPKQGETLRDFAARYAKDGHFTPFVPSRCPASACVGLQGVQPGMYGQNGDGHGRIVAFERDQPEYPGLLFESPSQPLVHTGLDGSQVYDPYQATDRIPGKLYYLVLLDTAASIEAPAVKDFDFFLQNLTVE